MDRTIVVNATAEENRVAVLDGARLEEFYVERTLIERIVGNVYKGRVESLLVGIGAAFVNIGLEKNGFLYIDDILEDGSPYNEIVQEEMGRNYKRGQRRDAPKKISDLLKKGEEVLVQVVKEPIGTKGARLTAHISLPGRYMVLMAHDKHRGVSRKIVDQKERKRLKAMIDRWKALKDVGLIVRTAASGHTEEELKREAIYLYNVYRRMEKVAAKKSAPALAHREYGLIQRMARDNFPEDSKLMAIDSRDEFKKTLVLLRAMSPKMRSKVKYYKGQAPIFEKFSVAEEIEKIYNRRVSLHCRGYIIIEPTESLIAIDVNTGRFTAKNPEDTAFIVNKEAAVEIARQLKLRDMGGIIVIDFIDMENKGHRKTVQNVLSEALKKDKARIKVLSISPFGLVEMTRQRMRRSLESASYQACPHCGGRGMVKSPLTMAIEVIRLLEKRLKGQRYKRVEVNVSPELKEYILQKYKKTIAVLGKRARCNVVIIDKQHRHIEDISVEVK